MIKSKNQKLFCNLGKAIGAVFFTLFCMLYCKSTEVTDISLFTTFFVLPSSLREFLLRFGNVKQHLFNNFCIFALDNVFLNPFVSFWHRLLFRFRVICVDFCSILEKRISMNFLALLLSIIFSRLNLAGYFLIFCLLIIRLDFSVLAIARFYKKYPHRLENLYKIQHRGMFGRAAAIAQEAATNPKVQATAVAVGGMVIWKALDVYDLQIQKDIADVDREAENARHAKDIAEAQAARADENRRHAEEMAMRKEELAEAQAARADENRRHAEEMAKNS